MPCDGFFRKVDSVKMGDKLKSETIETLKDRAKLKQTNSIKSLGGSFDKDSTDSAHGIIKLIQKTPNEF